MSAPLTPLQAVSEAKSVLRERFHEIRDGMRKTLPRPLRGAFYEKLIDSYNDGRHKCDVYITASRAEDGARALGEALAAMQQLYADALRSYQEGMDVLVTGGLIDESLPTADSQPEPGSKPHARSANTARRKRAGGL